MSIRDRTVEDLDACVAMASVVHALDGYPAYLRGTLLDFLASPHAYRAWVATSDDEIVGHIALHRSASPEVMQLASRSLQRPVEAFGVVARLLVAPSARRRGVATQLLATAADAAADANLIPILDVVTKYQSAVALYEQQGWTSLGRAALRLPDGSSVDELVFVAPESAP